MRAVILAGGLGTRLRPFTIAIPKPLLPLGDQPIIEILLRQLHNSGFTRVTLCLGHMAPVFEAFLGDGSRYSLRIDYFIEERPLGTAGALGSIPDLDDDFLVLNGDTLTDINFANLLKVHTDKSAWATIFCARVDEFVDYGVVEFDGDTQLLTTYTEKPIRHYYVSTGIYGLSRKILDYAELNAQGKLDMPDLLRQARKYDKPVCCYLQDGAYWRDIGRFDHYETASKDFQEASGRFLGKVGGS